MCVQTIRDGDQVSLLISKELSELINFYLPWNHQRTYGFLMILIHLTSINFLKRTLERISYFQRNLGYNEIGIRSSQLWGQILRHNYQETVNRLCSCEDIESLYQFLYYPNYSNQRMTHQKNIRETKYRCSAKQVWGDCFCRHHWANVIAKWYTNSSLWKKNIRQTKIHLNSQ